MLGKPKRTSPSGIMSIRYSPPLMGTSPGLMMPEIARLPALGVGAERLLFDRGESAVGVAGREARMAHGRVVARGLGHGLDDLLAQLRASRRARPSSAPCRSARRSPRRCRPRSAPPGNRTRGPWPGSRSGRWWRPSRRTWCRRSARRCPCARVVCSRVAAASARSTPGLRRWSCACRRCPGSPPASRGARTCRTSPAARPC